MLKVVALLLIINSVFGVCLEEYQAMFQDCTRLEDKAADKWCEQRYGDDFKAYYTTDTCSLKMSHELRDEQYQAQSEQKEREAVCATYSQALELSCELEYNYAPALRYCLSRYGSKYIPFIPTDSCSMKKASELRGERPSSDLLKGGLRAALDEVETLITMIDGEGIKDSFSEYSKLNTNQAANFYTKSMKLILEYLSQAKGQIYRASHLNVKIKSNDKYLQSFLRQSLRYIGLVMRVYKVYAVVAHNNQYVLRTYNFDRLKHLNLELRKELAIEILAKVNFKVKHINNDEDIEFLVSSEEKQGFEYEAISDPENKVEYAKLLTFLGIKETVTNTWGVQRLTKKDLDSKQINSCGGDFLSIRPVEKKMSRSDAMQELWSYDTYYNEYLPLLNDIYASLNEVSISDSLDLEALYKAYISSSDELIKFTQQNKELSKSQLEYLEESLYENEQFSWQDFSAEHIGSAIFVGDDIQDKKAIIQKLSKLSYKKRVETIISNFQGINIYISDKAHKAVGKTIQNYIANNVKDEFFQSLENDLGDIFSTYKSIEKRDSAFEEKVNETYKVISVAHKAFGLEARLSDKLSGASKPSIEDYMSAHNMGELKLIWSIRMTPIMKASLDKNPEFQKMLDDFFEKVDKEYTRRHLKQTKNGSYSFVGTRQDREKGLRQIAYDLASKYYKSFPYSKSKKPLVELYAFITPYYEAHKHRVVRDNTVVRIPIYSDNTVAPMTNQGMIKELGRWQKFKFQMSDFFKTGDFDSFKEPELPKMMTGDYTSPYGYVEDAAYSDSSIINDRLTDESHLLLSKTRGERNYNLIREFVRSGKKKYSTYEPKTHKISLPTILSTTDTYYIETAEELFVEFFKSLNLDNMYENSVPAGGFASTVKSQTEFLAHFTSQAYQTSPLLKSEITWKKTVTCAKQSYHGSYNGINTYVPQGACYEQYKRTLAQKIILSTYDFHRYEISDESAVKSLIRKQLNSVIDNTTDKLNDFCAAKFETYKDDENFRKIFNSLGFLRSSLKGNKNPKLAENIIKFDEEIAKEVRTWTQKIKEDVLEPVLMIAGVILIVSIVVSTSIASMGTALPAWLAGAASFMATATATLNLIEGGIAIIFGSLNIFATIQVYYVEMPLQYKFNESLVRSQLEESELITWQSHSDELKAHKKNAVMQVGFAALDLAFIKLIKMDFDRAAGVLAKKSYKRATGVSLRGFSAPPRSFKQLESFTKLRKEHGALRAAWMKSKNNVQKLASRFPRYQDIPVKMLRTTSLRQGLHRAMKRMSLNDEPWKLLGEFDLYFDRVIKGNVRFMDYTSELASSYKKAKNGLNHSFNLDEGTMLIKGMGKAWFDGNLISYLSKYGNEVFGMHKIIRELRADHIKSLRKLRDKMLDVKQSFSAKEGRDAFEAFLAKCTDDELLTLQRMVKSSKKGTNLRELKVVFKDYDRVAEGFVNPKYKFGMNAGKLISRVGDDAFEEALQDGLMYPENLILSSDVLKEYEFESEIEDIANFYESILAQFNLEKPKYDALRESIESSLAKHFEIDESGKRIYKGL